MLSVNTSATRRLSLYQKLHSRLLDEDNSTSILWLSAGPGDCWTIFAKPNGINLTWI